MKSVRHFFAVAVLLAANAAHAVTFTNATAIMATPNFGSAYVTLTSDKDTTLTSFSSPCCDDVELHTSSMKDGVMSMRKLDTLDLKTNVPIAIAGDKGMGDSMHLMLIGAHQEMKPGQHFPIIFHFAKGASQTTSFTVVERGAKTTGNGASAAQH